MGRSGAVVGSLGSGICTAPPGFFCKGHSTQTRLLHEDNGQRTFAVILETGEEVLTCLQRFVTREHVLAAQITAIGALSDAVLMYFDWDKKDYLKIPVREQVEVASLIGDVAEAPRHLGEAHVRPTLEVIVTESPTHSRKVKDPESGLALIRPAA